MVVTIEVNRAFLSFCEIYIHHLTEQTHETFFFSLPHSKTLQPVPNPMTDPETMRDPEFLHANHLPYACSHIYGTEVEDPRREQ